MKKIDLFITGENHPIDLLVTAEIAKGIFSFFGENATVKRPNWNLGGLLKNNLSYRDMSFLMGVYSHLPTRFDDIDDSVLRPLCEFLVTDKDRVVPSSELAVHAILVLSDGCKATMERFMGLYSNRVSQFLEKHCEQSAKNHRLFTDELSYFLNRKDLTKRVLNALECLISDLSIKSPYFVMSLVLQGKINIPNIHNIMMPLLENLTRKELGLLLKLDSKAVEKYRLLIQVQDEILHATENLEFYTRARNYVFTVTVLNQGAYHLLHSWVLTPAVVFVLSMYFTYDSYVKDLTQKRDALIKDMGPSNPERPFKKHV